MSRRLLSLAAALSILGASSLHASSSGDPDPASHEDAPAAPGVVSAAKSLERLYILIAESSLASVVQVLPGGGAARPLAGGASDPADAPTHDSLRGGPDGRGIGSGFVIDDAGTVVTAAHVVKTSEDVYLRLHDGSVQPAEIIGIDNEFDVAVLRTAPGTAPPLAWGDSRALRTGSIVFAVGHPFGLRNSVSQGIVSATDRERPRGRGDGFIQTDAAISPGNSGGPLVNLDGEVVGINTWVMTSIRGINSPGFAVPSNVARRVVDALLDLRESGGATEGAGADEPEAGASGPAAPGGTP